MVFMQYAIQNEQLLISVVRVLQLKKGTATTVIPILATKAQLYHLVIGVIKETKL